MAQNKYPRGSEWRKWDLHLHTASSYDYKYKAEDADEKLIEALKRNDIAVVAITDHFVINKQRINNLKEIAFSKSYDLIIFPGVELRTDKGGSNIHPIIIFDNDIDLDNLTEDFNSFKRGKAVDQESNEKIRWDYKDIVDFSNAHNGILTIHAGSKKNGIDEQISNVLPVKIATKEEYAQTVHILEIGKLEDIDEYKTFRFPNIGIKPMIMGSDNHNPNKYPNDHNSDLFTWIKADPTFEGLKQIVYEPESRVKIQADNPEFEKEKCPFTYIHIPNETKVFSEDDDIVFLPTTLPLNSSLVSIIGGRGTGKSQLINYLASAFNRNNNPGRYNLSTDITIGRKASVSEEATVFKVSEEPNAPFMYIAQSQIKELVEDKDKLSQNILETIGVTDVYSIPMDYLAIAETTVNEYNRVIKVLNADGKTILERKDAIQKEIKRYTDFIQNITSEQNRKKLEDYTKKVKNLHKIKDWQDKIKLQYDKNAQFVTDANDIIKKWNELFKNNGISIPLIDIHLTQDYLNNVLLARLSSAYQKTGNEIEDTKREFNNYKGDLTTLLSNISAYQAKVLELEKQKALLEQEEQEYQKLSTVSFKELGDSICKSIDNYTSLINAKWLEFKGDSNIVDSEKKGLLDIILQKELEVESEITLDTNRMYNLLLDKLDGRSYSIDKLHNSLNISTIDDFLDFVCQKSPANVFTLDKEDLRRQVLYLFYERYTDFISIGVKVTLNKKPITKLSFGQQGTIYLRLQIAAKMFSETIIYDQPEDDLDNDFISNELIPIFKKIKLYRQIIIVSHNANLVVNADSEQVIIAKNTDGKLSYMSGSLEDPFINSEVCRVLEGGQKAFEDRERKYRLS